MAADGMVEMHTTCRWCRKSFIFEAPLKGVEMYRSGRVKIQDAFPTLTADQRELLISHTCPKCWDNMCKETES